MTLFRDSLVPKGEESVQALDISYQAGDDGFLDLIDAQRVLLEFQPATIAAFPTRLQLGFRYSPNVSRSQQQGCFQGFRSPPRRTREQGTNIL